MKLSKTQKRNFSLPCKYWDEMCLVKRRTHFLIPGIELKPPNVKIVAHWWQKPTNVKLEEMVALYCSEVAQRERFVLKPPEATETRLQQVGQLWKNPTSQMLVTSWNNNFSLVPNELTSMKRCATHPVERTLQQEEVAREKNRSKLKSASRFRGFKTISSFIVTESEFVPEATVDWR